VSQQLYKIFRLKHQLWIEITFGSFSVSNTRIKDELYEISKIYFRHLKWLGSKLKDEGVEYDYDKDNIKINHNSNHALFLSLIKSINSIDLEYQDSTLFDRLRSDDMYVVGYLNSLLSDADSEIVAFDKGLKLKNKEIDNESLNALIKFLFDEYYKEYELILVYLYMQTYTTNVKLFNIFEDLISESHFHLKSFGNLMSELGILAVPRTIIEDIYKVEDIPQFLIDGIAEEEGAKILCQELASAIKDDELSKFFSFIDAQESYHVQLLKEAVEEF